MSDITLSKAVRTNLLSLQNTADLMATTQNRLATGKKVNSALDNPTNFFTASSLNSRAGDMNSLLDSMANGIQVLEAADNGISAITKTVESMQSTLRQARQDKSFQTQSFDVTADSVLDISGGTLAGLSQIKLEDPDEGVKASVSSGAGFTGPVGAASDELGAGAGARTVLTLDAADALAGETITVDGLEIAVDAGSNTQDAAAADIQAALNAEFGEGAYTVGVSATDEIIIENSGTTGTASTAPVVDLGTTAATTDSLTFTYDAARFGGTIEVDGESIDVSGSSVEDFVAAVSDQLGGDYLVSHEGDEVTIARAQAGAGGGITFAAADESTSSTTFTLGSGALDAGDDGLTFNVAGQEVAIGWNTDAATTAGDLETAIGSALTAAGLTASDYNVSVDEATGEISIAAANPGADTTAVEVTAGTTTVGTPTVVEGQDSLITASTTGVDGIVQDDVDAASQSFTVTYGNQSAEVTIGVGDADDIAASINEQLAAAGIAVEASIGDDGALALTSTEAESKTLAISNDASGIFGTDTVSVGEDPVAALNASKTVDKFVELINRDYGTSIRASNDNGRLRLENLSTTEMSVGVDKDGDGSSDTSATIAGNSVRDSLAAQFNELKDQLDKLSDDASFNGINLLRGDKLTITFNESGSSSIDIQTKNGDPITAANLSIDSLDGSDLDSDANIDSLLSTLGTALNELRSQASSFGSNLSSVQNRQDFTRNMINTLETGAANLTLADSNEEAANLLALQTRQQLSSTALSMASQQDQAVLRLF